MSGRKGSAGGMATAVIQRKAALERYYKSPNYCLSCGAVITVLGNQQVREARRKSFCNHTCAATHNNRHRTLNRSTRTSCTQSKEGLCQQCGAPVNYSLIKSGEGYYPRRYCNRCMLLKRVNGHRLITDATKGDLFNNAKNWQIPRSAIRKHAQDVYLLSGEPLVCKVCGYDKHIDVSHIKPVSDFSDDTPIVVINRIDNLVALCPNHHWEFDHGVLILENTVHIPVASLQLPLRSFL